MTLMIPGEEQPDRPTNDPCLSFASLEEHDVLVRAFRDFLISKSPTHGQGSLPEVVAEFSRRLTFLAKHVALDLQRDDVASMIKGLSDAKMAELALDSVDSPRGRHRLSSYLQARPFPHYEAVPTNRNLVVRIEENGSRVLGHFVDDEFVALNNEQ